MPDSPPDSGVNPRVEFYNKFRREMEGHDRDFEKKYDDDLNTTLVFSGLFSAVTSAFIVDVQSELKPDYEEMNNRLLEMLLNATTGALPTDPPAPVPRWPGPDPAIVQVQCIFYATLCATLLAAFLAMLGKQWLNRYRQSETHGSTADRNRMRERKLDGIETWKFHLIMESLPVILQCALALLGFALSRYLWEVNRSVSSVVIGFTGFGFLFYLFIVTVSVFSFNCPFQTPFSLMVHFVIGLAIPYWQRLQRTFGSQPPQPGAPGTQPNLPATIQPPWVVPLFTQEVGAEGDRLDAKCVTRMFVMSTDADVVTSIMDFIPEIIWHSGIKNVPLKRIYDILMDCFDFSGPNPIVLPRLRDVAYSSARAFAHISLQRRCITQYEEHTQDSWKDLCASHRPLLPADCKPDSDLATVLFMVDMSLGYDNGPPWGQIRMTAPHHAWMSHAFLYRALNEGHPSEVVMDFVENSAVLGYVNDIVATDCLFIIGLMVGVPFHSDITMRDKSREMEPTLRKLFGALSVIFSSRYMQTSLAVRALRLVAQLAATHAPDASYELFKAIMASDNLTDQEWEAARLAIRGAFERNVEWLLPIMEEPRDILKFLDYHLGLYGAEKYHDFSIVLALAPILERPYDPPIIECIRNLNSTSPPFVRGVRTAIRPNASHNLRRAIAGLIALVSDQWVDSTVPVMEPEEMSEFCEHLARFTLDTPGEMLPRLHGPATLFGMLRSPEWRKCIPPRFWRFLPTSGRVVEQESFRWCLRNAIEVLGFMRGLPDGDGLRRFYRVLWLHYDMLDTTVQGEVEKIAREMVSSDGLGDLNVCLFYIESQVRETRLEIAWTRLGVDDVSVVNGLRARLLVEEGKRDRLARIIGGG